MQIVIGTVIILLVAALLFVILVGIFYCVDFFLELPYVGAKRESIKNLTKLAHIKKRETVVDLGSGDGRLLFEAASFGAFAVGYEINPFLIALSKLKRKLKGLDEQVKINAQSMWKADLKVADVIFVYSLAKKTKKFEDFIYTNAQHGTRVVVNTNPFPNKKPDKTEGKIFLYII
ncbi:MAG: methyltransferase domain-containing protein [Patescibacteria group bacterium]